MHDQRLRLQHLYQDPLPIPHVYRYDLPPQQPINPLKHSLRIETHKLNLFSDYDLPLKQLQFTQTRQYKQNLNPIFQQLSTTHDRYSYSKDWNKKDKYDDLPVSDRYFTNQLRKSLKKQQKPDKKLKNDRLEEDDESILQDRVKVKELKQRSRVLSQNVKRGLNIQKGDDTFKHPQRDISGKGEPEYNPKEQLTSQQLAEQQLQRLESQISELQLQVKQSQQKVTLLKKQVSMHKQKQLIKQRQLFYLQQEKLKLQTQSNKLQQSLKKHAQKYISTETRHNQLSKRLRHKKQQLKKELAWIQQEKQQIKVINIRIEELLKLLRIAEQEQEKQEQFMKQFQQQQQLNAHLKQQLQQTQSTIQSLTQQTQLVSQQSNSLQMHLDQLLSLQQKFQQQTYALQSTIDQLNQQIAQKHQYISQQEDIDQLIKQLELEIGQINEKKIIIDQEIHQVHVKISLKNRNINYMKELEMQRQYRNNKGLSNGITQGFIKKHHYKQSNNTQFSNLDEPKYNNNQFSFTSLGNYNLNLNTHQTSKTNNNQPIKPFPNNNTTIHNNPQKQPLPTIRQNSNNTSAYQSPKASQGLNQQSQNSPKLNYQIKQQLPHHHQSQSLELDSRMVSQTDVLKPHQQQSPDKRPKKYYVIQSQDDGGLSNSKSAFAYPKSYLYQQAQDNLKPYDSQYYENHSEQIFIQKQKKPSIQHRLYDVQHSQVLRSQQQPQDSHQGKKSYSAQLQSSNYYQSANMNRLQSQQSEFPVVKIPHKSNDQKKTNKQKVMQDNNKHNKNKHYSNISKNKNKQSENQSIPDSQDVFQSLIEQYQHIKSNSCFQESWKHKI